MLSSNNQVNSNPITYRTAFHNIRNNKKAYLRSVFKARKQNIQPNNYIYQKPAANTRRFFIYTNLKSCYNLVDVTSQQGLTKAHKHYINQKNIQNQ